MDRVDLHAHTDHSDGTVAPRDLVRMAAEVGLRALAVTDHDEISALAEAGAEGERRGVEVIAGCEVSTRIDSGSVHVLGYGFDPADEALGVFLDRVREARTRRNEAMLGRLADLGLPLGHDEVCRHAVGRIVARPHFARAMIERGYVADFRAAFTRFIGDDGPAYVMGDLPAPEEAIEHIRGAGGAAVLAHPRQLRLPRRADYEALLNRLRAAGLEGLEVDHPSHDEAQREAFRALARSFDLVPTGGSDFHGENKPHIALGIGDGTIHVPWATWERLRERIPAGERG